MQAPSYGAKVDDKERLLFVSIYFRFLPTSIWAI